MTDSMYFSIIIKCYQLICQQDGIISFDTK